MALTQQGYAVEVARSGEEALGRLQERPVDLVISDLGMGAGMNGWDLAEQVRRRWPETASCWSPAGAPRSPRGRGRVGCTR